VAARQRLNRLSSPAPQTGAAKLSFTEQRELESLPDTIEALETEQSGINATLANPISIAMTAAGQDPASAPGVIETEIKRGMERWEALESKK